MTKFEALGLSQPLLDAISDLGFESPSEVQEKSIPVALEGKNVFCSSETGSGKTLAFGCGIIETVNTGEGMQALVLAPTRELAEQVKDSLKKLADQKRMNIISVYGGVGIEPQIRGLQNADVVVATPGRLLDHMERKTINLSKIKILVLDEADRMFDMGFIDDVERIIKVCPTKRQTLFFSATISSDIKRLATKYMVTPVHVAAKNRVDPSKLTQVYYDITKNLKLSLLTHLLKNENAGLVMVFCNTRRTVDFVVKNLRVNKIDATAIHGGLSQNKRTRTIQSFNSAKVSVLVCTDVAARGLHIDNVSHVYNYEIPKDTKSYVHRIGRTARAGEEGKAVNILCDYDYDNFSDILRTYREFTITKLEKPYLERVIAVRNEERRGGGGRFGNRGGQGGGLRRPNPHHTGVGRKPSGGGGNRFRRSSGGHSAGSRSRSGSRPHSGASSSSHHSR